MSPSIDTPREVATHRKLIAAIIGLCIVFGVETLREAMTEGWLGRVFYVACFAVCVWITIVGVMRGPALHYMWGWAVLILGGVMAGFLVSSAFGWSTPRGWPSSSISATLLALCALATGYLLLFDRDIRRHRAKIRERNHDELEPD
jgi:hypothetical protein